jgi:hypothetical protein
MQACNDYLRMGPSRSLRTLAEQYDKSERTMTPTTSFGTLGGWSDRYGWVERAAQYDARLEAEKNAEADRIMHEGLARVHERVRKLDALAGFLEEQLYERGDDGDYHNVWMPDVKGIGQGQYMQVIDIEHFNAALIREFRETLGDLAAETGGRVNKQEITGAGGGPLVVAIGGIDPEGDI